MKKILGKISNVYFGIGGYQDAQIGVHFTFEADGYGVCNSVSGWDANLIKNTPHCSWTEADRSKKYDEIIRFVSDLLRDAKVKNFVELKGKPVELTIDNNTLSSWRILTEVL